ncbi:MAG: transcription antitermination factor NusB [Ruminococcaceae bacterium]|nr:transcription antitermination factor NusB [Oscillospiraceae bacterium]
MTRTEARNELFILIFEKQFSESTLEDIVLSAKESRDFSEDKDGYIISSFNGVYNNLEMIDNIIAENLVGWTIDRISKVSLAVLRLALYEIKFVDEIPQSVTIDEAVELCKKYSTVEDASFVNGVLGSVVRA